ncbi:MAG: DUF1810 domain-containing protein [Bacteroidota bacterium]|nr:DUF1810 domain-containing protein [Bacteroidota bacterium]
MDATFDLDRFIRAQEKQYPEALNEISNGRKETHWMWFVFPQLEGLGFSPLSKKYGIKNRDEALAYLHHIVLGPRLVAITQALLEVKGKSAYEIMGSPDDLKLKSCMTLFALVSKEGNAFQRVLDKYFEGEHDEKTIVLLNK